MAGLDSYVKLYSNFNSSIQDDYGGKTLTGQGSASISTSQKVFGAGSLELTSATSDYVSIPDSSDWDVGSGNFTVDFRVRFKTLPGSGSLMCFFSQQAYGLYVYNNSGTYEIYLSYTLNGSSYTALTRVFSFVVDTWYWIELVREGDFIGFSVDGVRIGSFFIDNVTFYNSSKSFFIGASNITTPEYYLNGYIDEFRFSKGIARNSLQTFTPPTTALTPDSDDVLLLHMEGADTSTTFTDSSTFSPKFGTGMGKFDGTAHLEIPDHTDWAFGSGNFTIDLWIFPLEVTTAYQGLVMQRNNYNVNHAFGLFLNYDELFFSYTSNGVTQTFTVFSGSSVATNEWNHIAIVRNSADLKAYINGTQAGSTHNISTTSIYDSTQNVHIGCGNSDHSLPFTGYIDEVRISKGTAEWTTDFTPPSSEYSDSTYELTLHMNGTDESTTFTDSGATVHTVTPTNAVIKTSDSKTITAGGNAQIDTDIKKVGTSSGLFDGTGDYLELAGGFAFGSGDFTVDCWVYFDAISTYTAIYDNRDAAGGPYGLVIAVNSDDTLGIYFTDVDSNLISFSVDSMNLNLTEWYYLRVVRNGNYLYAYLNGVMLEKKDITGEEFHISNNVLRIGDSITTLTDLDGNLDEYRVSKIARTEIDSITVPASEYTEDTTAPTVLTLSPTNGASNVEPDANLVITFSEDVTAVASKYIQIKKTSDNSLVESIEATNAKVTVSGAEVTINPAATLDYNTRYYVVVDVGAFKDAASNDFAGILGTTSWTFRIRKIAVAGIFEVLEYQSTESAEAGTTTTNVTITDHGMAVGDFIVNTTRRGVDAERGSRRITAIVDDDNFTVTAITGQTTSDSIRLYKFVDRTNKVKTQTARCTLATQGMRTLSLMLVTTSSWMPIVGQYCRFSITQESVSTRYFLGIIQQLDTILATGNFDVGGGILFMSMQATNLNTIATRRTIQVAYDSGDDFGTIVEEMVDDYLVGDGIEQGTIDTGAALDEDWYDDVISISDVLDRAATESSFQWFIDENGDLQFYDEPGSFTNADYNIDETSSAFEDYFDVRISSNLDQYLNKYFIMGGTDERGNPVIISSEDFTESTAMQEVCAGTGVYGSILRDTGIEGSNYVSAGAGTTTTNVNYTSHNQIVGDMFWNLTRNEYRLVTAVVDADNFTVSSITSQTSGDIIVFFNKANDIIENVFKTSGRINYKLQFKTRYVGFEAGQKMTINLPTLGISNETFLIEMVEIADLTGRQDGDGGWLSVVTCVIKDSSNFSTKRLNNYVDFWANF